MGWAVRIAAAALAAGPPAPALAASDASGPLSPVCALEDAGGGIVAEALSGDTLLLADGTVVRLAGLLAPKPPLDPVAPAAAARDGLAALAAGREVTLRSRPGAGADRYGRALAFAFLAGDPVALQVHLAAAGHGRAEAVPDGACLAELLAAERIARAGETGLWADPYYQVRAADDASLAARTDLYEVVEGHILSVGRGDRSVFLDFGRNWNTDFTVTLTNSDAKLFDEALGGLDSLVGRRVRVRGWLTQWRGPAMHLTDPAVIEVLDRGG